MGDSLEDMDAQDCLDMCKKIGEWRPLKKPKFKKVKEINPGSKGFNVIVKCVKAASAVEGDDSELKEAVCGDDTAVVTISLRTAEHAALCQAGWTIRVQNAHVRMIKGF